MIRLGLIGTGGMANSHAKHYAKVKEVSFVACCDVLENRAKEFAEKNNIKTYYTDYRKMIDTEKLDGVVIASTDATHAEISIKALQKKIPVFCEKPMAVTVAEAKKMIAEAKKAKVVNMINFSKRNSSAVQWAKQYIDKGGIGRIMHVDAQYLQSWLSTDHWGDWRKESLWLWRLSSKHGSGGVLADIGCHIYDMASFLCGDIAEIYSELKTFPKAKNNRIGEYVLDANDSFVSTVTFKNGALGTVHCTRWATGYTNREFICIYGDKGAIEIDFNKGSNLVRKYTKELDAWETLACPKTPTNNERFLNSIKTKKKDASDFENGLKIQKYLEATFASAKAKKPVKIKS